MTRPRMLAVLLLLAATAVAAPWLLAQLEIDRCLDGGGRWNYDSDSCEGMRSSSAIQSLSSGPETGVEIFNATSGAVGVGFGDSDLESVRSLEPGARTEIPSSWASMIFIDRQIPGADPLHFLVAPETTDPDSQVLVLSGHSIYVVEASRWASLAQRTEEQIAAHATRRVLPLD